MKWAVRPLTLEALRRAKMVVCMEMTHKFDVERLLKNSTFIPPKVVVWHLGDYWGYCDPRLITVIRDKIAQIVKEDAEYATVHRISNRDGRTRDAFALSEELAGQASI